MNREYLLDSLNTIDKMVHDIRLHIVANLTAQEGEILEAEDGYYAQEGETDNQIAKRKYQEWLEYTMQTLPKETLSFENWLQQEDK